jgi:hypothetical protein
MLRAIADAGLVVAEQQRDFTWAKLNLSGHIDGTVGLAGSRTRVPLETKSCSPNIFPGVRDAATGMDLLRSRYSWVRHYPAQILLYMMMAGSEAGIMLFKNKSNGELAQKTFYLDAEALTYTEGILKKLEAVNAAVAEGKAPDAALIDECDRCPFERTACFVGKDYGAGYELLADGELEVKLDRRAELQPLAKEFDDLDNEVKALVRGRNVSVGSWIIESKEVERKEYLVKAGTYWKCIIKKLRG